MGTSIESVGGHDPFATSAGPFVLGALSPTDRDAFTEHLPSCPDCQLAVTELAGLPGLLSKVPRGVVEALHEPDPSRALDAGGVPETVLPAVLRALRTARRRRRRADGVMGGLVAAALVAAGVLVAAAVGYPVGPAQSPQAAPAVSASPTTGPSAPENPPQTMDPLLPSAITVTARLTPLSWGTEVDITCAYADDDSEPTDYLLVVQDTQGRTEKIGSWTAQPGQEMTLRGATALAHGDIRSVEVRTVTGTPVARLAQA